MFLSDNSRAFQQKTATGLCSKSYRQNEGNQRYRKKKQNNKGIIKLINVFKLIN